MTLTAYFDCFSGAAGDMCVASLIDAGADLTGIQDILSGLHVPGFSTRAEKVSRKGIAATRFIVEQDDAPQPHRHLHDVVAILEKADIPTGVRQKAVNAFTRLAQAEAKVHGVTVEKVHFHEVGAIDAIVDVVAAMAALELLGVTDVTCSAVPVGSGTVTCDHGVMPVPAPATAELLRGVPLAETEETGELVTPTGAALLTTLAHRFGPLPALAVRSIGYGAGTREGRTRPNVLRVLIGTPAEPDRAATDEVLVLETAIDDCSPEILAHCRDRLLEAGALDVYAVPIHMKKGRTGVAVTVICRPGTETELEEMLFAETTTLGLRKHFARRTKRPREIMTVQTRFGPVRVKVAGSADAQSATPEFEDCRAAAREHQVPLRQVMDAATAEFYRRGE